MRRRSSFHGRRSVRDNVKILYREAQPCKCNQTSKAQFAKKVLQSRWSVRPKAPLWQHAKQSGWGQFCYGGIAERHCFAFLDTRVDGGCQNSMHSSACQLKTYLAWFESRVCSQFVYVFSPKRREAVCRLDGGFNGERAKKIERVASVVSWYISASVLVWRDQTPDPDYFVFHVSLFIMQNVHHAHFHVVSRSKCRSPWPTPDTIDQT